MRYTKIAIAMPFEGASKINLCSDYIHGFVVAVDGGWLSR